jgi:hypothetical protein
MVEFREHVWRRDAADRVALSDDDIEAFRRHRFRFGFQGTYMDDDLRKVFEWHRLQEYLVQRDEGKQWPRWSGAGVQVMGRAWNMAKLSYEQRGRATRLAWDKRVTRATMLSWNLCTEEEARCEVCGVCEDTEHIAMRCRKIGDVRRDMMEGSSWNISLRRSRILRGSGAWVWRSERNWKARMSCHCGTAAPRSGKWRNSMVE